MSVQAISWAVPLALGSGATKCVLLLLANYADEAGTCFPGVARLARESNFSERTVRGAIDRLEAAGLLTRARDRKADGQLGITRYKLCVGRTAPVAGAPPAAAPAGGDQRHLTHQPAASDAPASGSSCRSEPSLEPSEEPRERERAREDQIPDQDLLDEMKATHPATPADSLPRIERAWADLGARQRQAAHRHLADWLHYVGHELRQGHVPRLSTYLGERRWQHLPDAAKGKAAKAAQAASEAPAAPAGFVAAFSRGWWWLFWTMVRALVDAPADKQAAMRRELERRVSLARTGVGWRVEPERIAGIEAAAETTLAAVPTDGDAVASLSTRARDLGGVDLPLPDRPAWLWAPRDFVGVAAVETA